MPAFPAVGGAEPAVPDPARAPVLRKLAPTDRAEMARHFLRLDPSDRRLRFCASVGDGSIRAYCERLDWSRTTVLGVFVAGDLRGLAELMLMQDALPFDAELALTVERPFQDRGLGTRLLRKTLVIARNRYIGSVAMFCLRENDKMRHIARKFGADLQFEEGQVEGRIWPPWPTYLSYLEEATLDGQALFQASFDTGAPAPPPGGAPR